MKECNQCGKCCIKYGDGGLSATTAEIEWWEVFRPEIFRYVKDEKIWIDPASGKQLSVCPWLEQLPQQSTKHIKYSCRIYHDRPEDCKHYPTRIEEMQRDECEMLEVIDLRNPVGAQKVLDDLMIDSRPPIQST